MKNKNILIVLLIISFIFKGCESIFDVDSDKLVFPDENKIVTQNDIIYSMSGLFSKLEKIAPRYVLLGELRGDLMNVTKYAGENLNEIYKFNISKNNPYNRVKDYYDIINNCNYLLSKIDTAIIIEGEKIMYDAVALIKAIRAWTYFQIALNYGKVKYYEKPILTLKDTVNYQEYDLNDILQILINDLEPWKFQKKQLNFSLGTDLSSNKLYFPVRFVLGDLYLWIGEYEKAAQEYYELINENNYIINQYYRSTWTVDNGVFVERKIEDQLWTRLFNFSNSEIITLIANSTEFGKNAELDSLSLIYPEITPSDIAIKNWNSQLYYYNSKVFNDGDLRGDIGSYINPKSLNYELISFLNLKKKILNDYTILKYFLLSGQKTDAICIYRVGLLYLRYAEAINRSGRPNVAFAVLKHGLKSSILKEDTIIPKKEKYISFTDTTGILYRFIDFTKNVYDNNIGMHMRGCGNVNLSNDYKIPALNSLEDSILFVEDRIIDELALETAFEGNRFHDLMRIALRRNNPEYLANKISEKYFNKEEIKLKLLNKKNWFITP